ncbi:hypothetical protein [Sphingomonas abietis]|uniref:Uncharacterized protein n=1 Tax=Sphingomonas abietis TaxID=3012344 RepID=A0ABY7NQG6_9SPHN|nr:hypothetical protein [Sphingomonas abietis]WBO23055.1 hypothetical protein PBT88_02640 [Sphingomonas abietis]
MIISSNSATSALTQQLQANGLSDAAVKQVNGDLAAAVKDVTGASGGSADAASVRAALDQRISADVASGKLSAGDAAKVSKTLDQIDGQASGSGITSQSAPVAAAPASGAAGAAQGGGGGGGGGGGSASKTELSRAVTISGATETTIITYTDGSTATTTTVASDADKIKYGKPAATDANGTTSAATAAQDYLSTIEPGSLIDQQA